jgi:hypothetical protein
MALQDSTPFIGPVTIPTDAANTDYPVTIPFGGSKGYVINSVRVYDALGGSSASALLGLYTAPAAGGTAIITPAALTTHSTQPIVSSRTVIAAAAQTTAVTASTLYLRVTTASGVAGTTVKVIFDVTNLPGA